MVQDKWSDWLLRTRFGGDETAAKAQLKRLGRIRDAVLDGAALREGQTALDVGAGDGLIAFGALDRVGATGRVILADISQPLLDHARTLAESMGAADRCAFINTGCVYLEGIDDESVDAVMTRSVLIYVADKAAALREFHRVLVAGGRISIWEPINRFAHDYGRDKPWGSDIDGIADLAERLSTFYGDLQPMDSDPMLNFDERDLLGLCEDAGFQYARLKLVIDVFPAPPWKWEVFANMPGNPNIPPLAEAIERIFTEDERARYLAAVRPGVEAGGRLMRSAAAHLVAVKDGRDEPLNPIEMI
jgi:SAM-dependent methyltransferase